MGVWEQAGKVLGTIAVLIFTGMAVNALGPMIGGLFGGQKYAGQILDVPRIQYGQEDDDSDFVINTFSNTFVDKVHVAEFLSMLLTGCEG